MNQLIKKIAAVLLLSKYLRMIIPGQIIAVKCFDIFLGAGWLMFRSNRPDWFHFVANRRLRPRLDESVNEKVNMMRIFSKGWPFLVVPDWERLLPPSMKLNKSNGLNGSCLEVRACCGWKSLTSSILRIGRLFTNGNVSIRLMSPATTETSRHNLKYLIFNSYFLYHLILELEEACSGFCLFGMEFMVISEFGEKPFQWMGCIKSLD